MDEYFEVVVDVVIGSLKNGKDKKTKEVFLVNAQSVTEAEVKVSRDYEQSSTGMNFQIVAVKKSRVFRVI